MHSLQRWNRLREVFEQALELTPQDREAFVQVACSNSDEAGQLRSLLNAHDVVGDFFSSAVVQTALTLSETPPMAAPRLADRSGRTLSHYLLKECLGAGGMGVVYRAEDLALGRSAAIKMLPEHFHPELRRRLIAEAAAASKLQHPAIATFYEAGEEDGQAFIAMELIEGMSVRSALAPGPLEVVRAVAAVVDVLEALGHAHQLGLLHRDLKPENVMLTARGATLLDFGLAKEFLVVAAPSGGSQAVVDATGAGIVGTLGYMSPEQVCGTALGPASDIFQAGALLYEALAGRPAFPGRNPMQRVAAVLVDEPLPLDRPDLPSAVRVVIEKALQKDPGARYATAGAMCADLRDAMAGTLRDVLHHTVAILDFATYADPDDAWLGAGLVETLETELGRTNAVRVAPRGKVHAAQRSVGGDGTDAAIGVALSLACRWGIRGSVQRSGDRVRVSLAVVDARTRHTVLSDRFDGSTSDPFELQDRIVAAVREVMALGVRIQPSAGDVSADVFEWYARARVLQESFDRGARMRARELFERVVEAQPNHAGALSALASNYALSFIQSTDVRVLDKAIAFADRAIAVDPTAVEAHVWRGYALSRQRRHLESSASLARARELDPSNFYGWYFGGGDLREEGRYAESLPMSQRAVELAPLESFPAWLLGGCLMQLGRLREARWAYSLAIENERRGCTHRVPDSGGYLGEALRRMGHLAEAREVCLASLRTVEASDHTYRDTFRVVAFAALGRTALAQGDRLAAVTAFRQGWAHLRGRPTTLGGGQLLVQLFAGLAQSGEGVEYYSLAVETYGDRSELDWSWLWVCTDDVSALELARAACAVGQRIDTAGWLERARQLGSMEAQTWECIGAT